MAMLKPHSHLVTIDNKMLPGDYLTRLLHSEQRVYFDITCNNLQDIVYNRPHWGIDVKGQPHDFSKPAYVPVEKRKVVKVKDNIFWVKNISYPFDVKLSENIRLSDDIYATVIFVNGEWYLRELSYDNHLGSTYIQI